MQRTYDFDWLVIGSGFGGSVSAMRLTEKRYSVGVLECGRRYEDEDFAETTWQVSKYYWLPRLGMKGILRLTIFKDIFVASGCGVGGGSLGYANTLYQPKRESMFYSDPQWAGMADWYETLDPHYREAERMLGVTTCELEDGPADTLLQKLGEELGVGGTYSKTRVGVYFGEAGKTVPDPYFGGEGPDRAGCIQCGSCMVGCRHNAKNTLTKNYLWFAERGGVKIMPERTVVEVRPLDAPDGSDGYSVTSERSGAWFRKDRQTLTARNVVVAAGPLGTNQLLRRCKDRGALPRLSERLGHLVRTNSEAVTAVTTKNDRLDFTKSVAITSSIYPTPDTHIENVTYGRAGGSVAFLFSTFAGPGSALTRPLKALAKMFTHPIEVFRANWPVKWSQRTIILLTMQTLDNSMRLRPKRNPVSRLLGLGPRLQTEEDPDKPNPRYIEVADWATKRAAQKLDATPQRSSPEAFLNRPTTAHVLGGAVIGESPETGVVDARHRVFGYENLMVCDGSAIPANIGVNPSLTITAMAEHAMSHIPSREADETPETVVTEA